MIYRSLICSVLLALVASPAVSAEEAANDAARGDEMERLPEKLDDFVQTAIDQGLLTKAGTSKETQGGARSLLPDTPEDQPAATFADHAQPDETRPTEALVENSPHSLSPGIDCAADDPYDFSELASMSTYSDFMSWRGVLETEQTPAADTLLAKAYIALGLTEEARMQLQGKTELPEDALRQLAILMDGRSGYNVPYFTDIAACYPAQKIWLGVAKIGAGHPDGVRILTEQIEVFHDLPLRLRIAVAMKIIPALSDENQVLLSEKLLATFSSDEIEASARLQFLTAVKDLVSGRPGAEAKLRQFYHRIDLRDAAATVLRRHGLSIDKGFEAQLVDKMVGNYSRLPAEAQVDTKLDSLLRDLNDAADYDLTLKLASLPAAQRPEARQRLGEHFSNLIEADLKSDVAIDNLKMMDALLKSGDLLEGREDYESKFGQAAALAAHMGLQSMSDKLAARVGNDDALALARAQLAYRLMDHEGLAFLARLHATNPDIAQLAALDAIRTNDADAFSKVQNKLSLAPEAVLELITADAASGNWVVTGRFYDAAAKFEDEEIASKAARIIALKKSARLGGQPLKPVALADVSGSLDELGQSIQPATHEVN
ncbi:hypothetical protein [Henriciella litoralis]|uniref:hypothetical protein n=1 Tax=Henriciella litoralis TaxID=568102 RepID=UPI000A05328F|nr:hypothetical protein [Henriciella litoralis]